jgi:hypothetical protein
MTLTELYAALVATGIPIAYRSFNSAVTPPYAVYYEPQSDPIASDHKTLGRWGSYRVELYTLGKDLVAERTIEAALDSLGVIYGKEEAELAEEKLLEIIYEFEGVES